jgi:arylsulfatase A-like enzyme
MIHLRIPSNWFNGFTYFLSQKFSHTIENIDRRKYAAMVTALDQSVGDIYEALKKKKIEDNTVIIFTTDNGGAPDGFNW